MRKIHTVGLALVAVVAFSAMVVASASALEWLSNGNAIATAQSADSTGTLELEDMGAGVTLLCTGTDKGTVGPGAADKETTVTATTCKTEKGTCGSPKAEALKLPWSTELGAERDTILGTPGWNVICFGFIEDECTGESSTAVANEAGGVVATTFDEASAAAKCSIGGNNSGLVHGTVTILLESGAALTTS